MSDSYSRQNAEALAKLAATLERLADAMDRITTGPGIERLIVTLKPLLAQLEDEKDKP